MNIFYDGDNINASLPESAMEYKGGWDANTNTPTLTSGVGNNGDMYLVTVAGTTNIDGISTWNIGDMIVFNGTSTAYERVGREDLVSSVFSRTGAVTAQSDDYSSFYSGINLDSTGILSGGALTINADTTKFDLAAGKAYIVDNTDPNNVSKSLVEWTSQTALSLANLLTAKRTDVGISLTNTASPGVSYTNSFSATVNGSSQTIYIAEKSSDTFSSEQYRKFARLGRLSHSNQTNISIAIDIQRHTNNILSGVLDFIDQFPAINVEGNAFSGVTSTLSVQKTAGKGYRFGSNFTANPNDPNIQTIPAANPTTHAYRWRDGSGDFNQSSSLTTLNTAVYDDGSGVAIGSLPAVNNNEWTIQPVWVFAGSGSMFIQFGQEKFSSKTAALEALSTFNPVLDQNLVNDAVFRGYFVVRGGAADTTLSGDFEWRAPLGELGSGSGSTVVIDVQTAYNNSFDPEITTDSTRGALTIKRGSAADTDDVLETQNGAGTQTFSVKGNGLVTLSNAIQETKASNIASATTTDIGAASGNFIHITGTTTITALGTVAAGVRRIVTFDGALTLTHNATSLILPGGANITTAAGDSAIFISEGSGNWRCVSYVKADGTPVVNGAMNTLSSQQNFGYQASDDSSGISSGGTQYSCLMTPQKTGNITGIAFFVTNASAQTVYVGVYNSARSSKLGNGSGSSASLGRAVATLDSSVAVTAGTPIFVGMVCGSGAPNFLGDTTAFGANTGLCVSGFYTTTPTSSDTDISDHTNATTTFHYELIYE